MGKSSKIVKAAETTTTKSNPDNVTPVAAPAVKKDLIEEHLPPIGLVFTIIACSGFLFMFAFRDVFATGRNIGGAMDDAYLVRLGSHFLVVFDLTQSYPNFP